MSQFPEMFSLAGKAAIVTGANRGLGQGIAIALAEAGADIFGVCHSGTAPDTKKAVEAQGRRYVDYAADLSDTTVVPALFSAALKEYGKIDILVNNAGIIRRQDAIEFPESEWDEVMNTDLKTVFLMCQAAGRQFLAQKSGGKIINVASMLSFQGGIRVPSYTAAKFGVKGITMALANEWARLGINVNAIAPGYMATDNTAALRADGQRSADILARIPANRWGTPADMGGAAVFLASRASDYVNGFTLAVDGGWLGR
jgi:2-deoxy-D-gluconate 3-dehydrogenase